LGSSGRRGKAARRPAAAQSPLTRLALHLNLVKEGLRDAFESAAIEVALMVEPAFEANAGDGKATAAWCGQLREMYRGWSNNRHMQTSEMLGRLPGDPPLLLIAGFAPRSDARVRASCAGACGRTAWRQPGDRPGAARYHAVG
jgi:hypothetical protein